MPFDFGNMALAAMDANKEYAATQEKLRATRETESLARDRMAQERDFADQKMNLERDRFNQEKAVYQGNEMLRKQQLAEAEERTRKAKMDADMTEQDRATYDINQLLQAGKIDDPRLVNYLGQGVKPEKISDGVFETSKMIEPPDGKGPARRWSGVAVISDDKKPLHVYADDELPGALRLILPTDNADQIAEKLTEEGLPKETIGAAIEIRNAQAKRTGAQVSSVTSERANSARIAFHNSLTASVKEHENFIDKLRDDMAKQSVSVGSGATAVEIKSPDTAKAEYAKRLAMRDALKEGDPKRDQLTSDTVALKSYLDKVQANQNLIDTEARARDNTIAIRDSMGQVIAEKLGGRGSTKRTGGAGTGEGEPPPAPAKGTPDANLETLIQNNPDPAMRAALIEYQDEGRTQNTDETWSTKPRSAADIGALVKAMEKGPEAVRALAGKTKAAAASQDVKTQLRKAEEAEPMSAPAYLGNAVLVGMKETAKDVGKAFAYGDPPKYGDLVAAGVPEVTVKDINTYWGLANKIEDTTLRSEIKAALKSRAPERTKIAITELAKMFPSKMESAEAIYARKAPPRELWFWEKPK